MNEGEMMAEQKVAWMYGAERETEAECELGSSFLYSCIITEESQGMPF